MKNEELISWALKTFPELQLIKPEFQIGSPGLETSSLSPDQQKMVLRFDPASDVDDIGFFAAKFQKNSNC